MKIPELFNRNELSRTLWDFRREFLVAGIFSMVANLLMLVPTIYMLQIFDRVMVSQSTSPCKVMLSSALDVKAGWVDMKNGSPQKGS